jgi:hypothetical protein
VLGTIPIPRTVRIALYGSKKQSEKLLHDPGSHHTISFESIHGILWWNDRPHSHRFETLCSLPKDNTLEARQRFWGENCYFAANTEHIPLPSRNLRVFVAQMLG